jgi:hypothetical protein
MTTVESQLHQLKQYAALNPTRKACVPPIEIRINSDTQEGQDAPATVAGSWIPVLLDPPGPVSLYLWKTDPEFRAGTVHLRRAILRDTILLIHARVDAELRGHKYSRKKILEQLSAQQTAAISPPQDTPELDEALCVLFGYQKVVVDEANRRVLFFPEDPRTWNAEFPTWGASLGTRAALHKSGEASIAGGLTSWLEQRESDGWKIQWPEAEGSLEEIKAKFAQRSLTLRSEKPKKADYAAALGRAEALSHIRTLSV